MGRSNSVHTFTQLLSVTGILTITAPESPYVGSQVELLGRRENAHGITLLLLRQESIPHLIEIPATHTNICEIKIVEGEPQKLVAQQLLKTAAIVAAAEKRLGDIGAVGVEVEKSPLTPLEKS